MLSAETSDILAACVIAALCSGAAGWAVRVLRRSPFTTAQSLLYALAYVIARVIWRLDVRGRFPIDSGKGAVVICNHRSSLDPTFIAMTVPRLVHWMVAREFCESLFFRRMLKVCGSIPVGRAGYDTAAAKAAIRIVESGGLVGIFPEGGINETDQFLRPGRSGAALIALKARAPVVPCYIENAPYDGTPLGCLLMPAAVTLTIGEPIDLSAYYDGDPTREVLNELTLRFLRAIAQLAGHDDYQPRIAGPLARTDS
jgi:1-acyl-sn-glycerol-3-phosphate acyltransferase